MPRNSKVNEILEERLVQYGNAEERFSTIGRIWGALLNVADIPPHQVALMMDSLKTVRCFTNPEHTDSWDDKVGYTLLGQEIVFPA